MLRDAGVALIQEQLAFRTTLSSNIVTWMQLAQTTLEKGPTKPWFLVSEDTFTTTVSGEERVSLPLTFLQEVEDATFKYRPSTWPDEPEVDLVKDEYDVLRRNYRGSEAGPPEAYALLGDYFRLFPTPDDAYAVRLIFYEMDDVLSTNIENRWLKEVPLLLLGSAGLMISGSTVTPSAKANFQDWVNTGLKVVHAHDVSREMANRVMQVGGPAV